VKAFADATAAYNLEQLIALTPPQEMRALHDYAPLFLTGAREATSQLKDNTGLVITITRLDLDPSGDGDRRSVAVTGFAAHVESNDGSGDVDFDGKCFTVTGDLAKDLPNGTQKSCTGDISPAVADLGLDDLAGRVGQPLTITVVKEDGKWYVSPIGTVGETFERPPSRRKTSRRRCGVQVHRRAPQTRSEFGIEGADHGGGPSRSPASSRRCDRVLRPAPGSGALFNQGAAAPVGDRAGIVLGPCLVRSC
jgi:hypothetical protein